ncbi:MAG: hypothetical protein PHT07_00360 [Paludibacter sp.]|nr:hypothetical protein [Paludibacter sp.]
MAQIAGIKYETDARGTKRFVRIDLKKYGNSPLLEDFLDSVDIEKRKGEETVPLEEVIERLNKKSGKKDV